MAVRLTEKYGCYWNNGVHQFAKDDVVPSGEFANYLLATGAPVEELADGPAVDLDGDGVPDGTIAQVLEWVGNDPARAARALEAEQAGKNRATLTDALTKLVGSANGAEGGGGAADQG